MISYDSLRYFELSDDVVKHKKFTNVAIVKKSRHSLSQFSEIINDNDDLNVLPGQGRITLHKIDSPFFKGANDNNGIDPDLYRNTMKYRNTHKHRDAVEIRLHFINNK
jgi:hypothetical protein